MLPLSRPSPPPAPQAGTGPGDLAPNSGRCPDRGWNQRPFGSQAGAQSTELHQPEPMCYF